MYIKQLYNIKLYLKCYLLQKLVVWNPRTIMLAKLDQYLPKLLPCSYHLLQMNYLGPETFGRQNKDWLTPKLSPCCNHLLQMNNCLLLQIMCTALSIAYRSCTTVSLTTRKTGGSRPGWRWWSPRAISAPPSNAWTQIHDLTLV